MKTRRIVEIAVFAAITAVLTFALPIPSPAGGYIHFGDSIIYLAALLLGYPAAYVGSIGGAISDILGGFVPYAIPTAIIKAAMAVCAVAAFKKIRGPRGKVLGFIFGSIVMIVGYYIAETIMLGSLTKPLVNVPYNLIQALVSIPLPLLIAPYLKKIFNSGTQHIEEKR